MLTEERAKLLQRLSIVIGVVIGMSTITVGVKTCGVRIAEADFITKAAAKEREAELIRQFQQIIAQSEALAAQREAGMVQRVETLDKNFSESNTRMQTSIDRILNLLLSEKAKR